MSFIMKHLLVLIGSLVKRAMLSLQEIPVVVVAVTMKEIGEQNVLQMGRGVSKT